MNNGWVADQRLVVLHVVESFGSGTASAVTSYTASTPEVEHHLLYAVRSAAFTAGDEFKNFTTINEFSRTPWLAVRSLRAAMKRVKPDVVHAHSSFAGLLVRSAVRRSRKLKIVYTPHCFGFERLDYNAAVRIGIRAVESILGINTTEFAACSQYEAELCRRIAPGRPVSFVPNVDDSAPVEGSRTKPIAGSCARSTEAGTTGGTEARIGRTIMAMGRLETQKDPAWFGDACRIDATDRRWIWIGGGSSQLHDDLQRAGVEVTGWLPRAAALELLASASVYVHTAAWEGFPVTVLEASSRGVPVVVRAIPCFRGLPTSVVADSPGAVVEVVKTLDVPEAAVANAGIWADYLAINTRENQRRVLLKLYRTGPSNRTNSPAGSADGGALVVHWGRNGGGPRFTYELSRSLHEAGQLCGVSYNDDSELSQEFAQLDAARLPVRTYRSKVGVVLGLPRLLMTAVRFRKFVLKTQPDYVVCAMENVYQSAALPLFLPRRTPYFFSVHDATDHPGEENLLKRGLRHLEHRRAHGYLTYSRSVGEKVRSQANKPVMISVLPASASGPSESELRSDCPRTPVSRSIAGRDKVVVGFFGRLQPYKGIEQLLEAARILDQEGAAVRISVWGSGPESHWQHQDRSGLIDWHVGWVPEAEVLRIVESFDVLVCPYQEASQSLVISQAMACGVPAVVTPVGGIQEQVSETGCGIVCADPSAQSIAAAIHDLIADPQTYERLSSSARSAAARQYSWERLTEDLVEFGCSVTNAGAKR